MPGGYHPPKPKLTRTQIIHWAKAYRARHGRWPTDLRQRIPESPIDTWEDIRNALRYGRRGLRGDSSLSKLLAEFQGIPYHPGFKPRPVITKSQILAWARAYYRNQGVWPGAHSGAIVDAGGLTWGAVDLALRHGFRGLPGGDSLGKLVGRRPGGPKNLHRSRLTCAMILTWADAHRKRTGKWPNSRSGIVIDEPREHWDAINSALKKGLRGLPGSSSLAVLLKRRRNAAGRNIRLTKLSVPKILRWIRAYHRRTGRWPKAGNQPIPEAPGETWNSIRDALWGGHRGLPGGSSLARVLAEHFGVRNVHALPKLTEEMVLRWADAHYKRTKKWPSKHAGAIPGAGAETWVSVCDAMYRGGRGWRGGMTLPRLLSQRRGARIQPYVPRLTEDMILEWAAKHRKRYGEWPYMHSGAVLGAPGEKWKSIDANLRRGGRGLKGSSSLCQLLGVRRNPGKWRHR